jgi:hypothetical protein
MKAFHAMLAFGVVHCAASIYPHLGTVSLDAVVMNESPIWRAFPVVISDSSKPISALLHVMLSPSVTLAVASVAFLAAWFTLYQKAGCLWDFSLIFVMSAVFLGTIFRAFSAAHCGLVAPVFGLAVALILQAGLSDFRPARVAVLQLLILPLMPGFSFATAGLGACAGLGFWLCTLSIKTFAIKRMQRRQFNFPAQPLIGNIKPDTIADLLQKMKRSKS